MESVSLEKIYAAVEILGEQEGADEDAERLIRALVTDELTVRRLADVIPEAFGIVVASHLPGAAAVTLPASFYAKDVRGEWQSFPFDHEPIFAAGIMIAQHIFHNGPRHILKNIADRSGLLAAISNALDKGGSLEGSTLSGPSFFGIPASLYESPHWRVSRNS